jgi:hypothetical protein
MMPRSLYLFLAAVTSVAVSVRAADAPAGDAKKLEFFEQKIRPVLVEQCYKCHSATSEKLKGDLLVDSRAGLLKGGASKKPSIVPGEPEKSPLIHAIRGDDEDSVMPPKGDGLTKQQVADFVAWVKMGSPDPRTEITKAADAAPDAASVEAKAWWSFQPVKDVSPPIANRNSQIANPLDAFLAAKHREQSLVPTAPADKRTLIRRATFDLTGLPPTPDEVDGFVADPSPDAFARVIDRLLASKAYGERWGRRWLDVVRYADTAGESADYPVPQAYLYRNYVIDAFNADTPYDRFLTEQIAGDLLPAKDEKQKQDQVVATGFLAISRRFSVAPEREMHLTYDDTIDTLGKGLLGLTLSCARCHDHKFDSIPATDYFALYGILASTKYPFPGSEERRFQTDMVVLASAMTPDVEARYKAHSAKVAELEKDYLKYRREARTAQDTATRRQLEKKRDEAKKAMESLVREAPEVPSAYAVQEQPADQRRDAKVMKRGGLPRRG